MVYEYRGTTRVPEEDIAKIAERLMEYKTRLASAQALGYGVPEAALHVPFDDAYIERIAGIVDPFGKVRGHVILVGIGGSSAGTEAVYDALRDADTPLLHVLDVVDGGRMDRVLHATEGARLEDIAVVIISKSGTTAETIANADVLLRALKERYGADIKKRVIVVSDEGTPLSALAEKEGYVFADIPSSVGGRYSVFTAVGLVPLALLGFDIGSLLEGAATAIHKSGSDDPDMNAALAIAGALWQRGESGARLHILFPESERLSAFARWYEQLLAESLGKEARLDGAPWYGGLAPSVMTPRHLHSSAQLYLSGFKNVFTTFMSDVDVPLARTVGKDGIGGLLAYREPRSYEVLTTSIMIGVREAYQKHGLPFGTMLVGTRDMFAFGATLAECMLAVMYLAHLAGIDAFDQPHVELYKKETREILGS